MGGFDPFWEAGRHNPAPGVHIQVGGPNCVFLTVRTKSRVTWLANATTHRLLHEVWMNAKSWLIADYLLMPDHLHCFCAPNDLTFTIEQWIAYWKKEFRRLHNNSEWQFQSRGWHHRLRDDENYTVKWNYIQENPVRKGFVRDPGDWPFKGRVHDIHW